MFIISSVFGYNTDLLWYIYLNFFMILKLLLLISKYAKLS